MEYDIYYILIDALTGRPEIIESSTPRVAVLNSAICDNQ